MFAHEPLIAAARQLFPWAEQNYVTYGEDMLTMIFAMKNAKKYIGIGTIGYHYHDSIGVMAASRNDILHCARMLSIARLVYIKMVIDMAEFGDPAYAMRILRRLHPPFYEHIATLPLPEGIDLFSKYIGSMSPKMQRKVARKMRHTFPQWRWEIAKLAWVARKNITAAASVN